MGTEVVVTGFGVFSGYGFGAEPLLAGAFAGKPAFRPVTRFDTSGFRTSWAAAYDGAWPHASTDLAARSGTHEVFRECVTAALTMAEVTRPERTGLVLGTNPAPGETDATGLPAELAHDTATSLGLGFPRRTFTNACVASASAIIHAAQLIATGRATTVVCGGAQLVSRQVFGQFDAVRALSPTGTVLPFSRARQGLLHGDGVAAIVLEAGETARARGVEVLARVAGWAQSDDAHHVVHPDPAGVGLAAAVSGALRRTRIAPSEVGYLNAHGTATRLNDVAEVAAIRTAFGAHARSVPISSTKSTTGHALEGCGALETVITMLALRHGVLPPTAGLEDPEPDFDLDLIAIEPRAARPRHAMTVNAALGGVNAAIVLERP